MEYLRRAQRSRDDGDELLAQSHLVQLFEFAPGAAHRALQFLYQLQTADEQAADATLHRNGMGFAENDARQASALARAGRVARADEERCKQLAVKYAMQILRHADDEQLAHIADPAAAAPTLDDSEGDTPVPTRTRQRARDRREPASPPRRAPRKRARRERAPSPPPASELEDSSSSEEEEEAAAAGAAVRLTGPGAVGGPVRALRASVLNDLDEVLAQMGVDVARPTGLKPEAVASRMRALHPGLTTFDVHMALYAALRRAEPRPGDRAYVLWEDDGAWYGGTITELTRPRNFPRLAYDDADPPTEVIEHDWMYVCG